MRKVFSQSFIRVFCTMGAHRNFSRQGQGLGDLASAERESITGSGAEQSKANAYKISSLQGGASAPSCRCLWAAMFSTVNRWSAASCICFHQHALSAFAIIGQIIRMSQHRDTSATCLREQIDKQAG